MQRILATLLIGTSLTLFAGCSDSTEGGNGTEEHNDDDGHDHGDGGDSHDEEGQGHEGDGDDHDHSHDPASVIAIGANTVDGVEISVDQLGPVHPGDDTLTFWVRVESQADVSAVRVVVTTPSGAESLKVRAVLLDSGVWDADVTELPAELGAGSQAQVEVELASGEIKSSSFGLSIEG